jgi:septal ring factor EnvC (AmiA/AmiB activator)
MVIALIIVVVLALALAVFLYLAKLDSRRLRSELELLSESLEEKSEENSELDRLLHEANNKVEKLNLEAIDLKANIEDKEERLEKVRSELADKDNHLEMSQKKAEELKSHLEQAEQKIVDLAARPDVVLNELASNGSQNASALWELELARSERAWRNSVAINPVSDESPFGKTEDPVRLAVEVEAAALREDVGALIAIEWKAKPIKDPARAHLVVRVAQELLASAAKSTGATKLIVSGSKDLKLRCVPDSQGKTKINLIPPQIKNDLIDVTKDDGVTVTVKS